MGTASTANRLLASLPEGEMRAIAPHLHQLRLPAGRVLQEPGEQAAHVYFPLSGIVSMVHINGSGIYTELALVGTEGLVGLEAILGWPTATLGAVVQSPGAACRLPAAQAKAGIAMGGSLHRMALRFAHALMLQVSQTAVCNLRHSVDQQLCRWLLACLDRLPDPEIRMTHELIATLLGVRRQGITEAAKRLEKRGIISYFRGHITVLDRPALERSACDCYALQKRHTELVLAEDGYAPPR